MSFLFLDPKERRQSQQTLELTPSDPTGFEPGFFEGMLEGVGSGAGRAFAATGQVLGEVQYQLGSIFTRPIDALFDTEATEWLDLKMRQEPRRLTASMTPDPYSVGTAGNILYSLIGIGAPAVVGSVVAGPVGGALAAGSTSGLGTFADLTEQGVDQDTAAGAATIDAALAGVGVALPGAFGSNVLRNTLLYGPGVNVAQDLLAGQSIGAVLDSAGYPEMARRYDTIQGEALAASAILGGVFGYVGARGNRPPALNNLRGSVEAADNAMTALAVKNIEVDLAPGLARDVATLQAHTRALDDATVALLNGERVTADTTAGGWVEKPVNPDFAPDAVVRALRESGLPGLLDEIDDLEVQLAQRGLQMVDEALPDVPDGVRRPADPDVPPTMPEAGRRAPEPTPDPRPILSMDRDDGVVRATAKTKAGQFTLVDDKAPAGTEFSEFGQVRLITAYDGDREIGTLRYANDGTPPDIKVDPEYRRRGVGTAMLALAKKRGGVMGDAKTGLRGKAAEYRTPDGQAFRSAADESTVELTRIADQPEAPAAAGKLPKLAPGEQGVQSAAGNVLARQPDLFVVDENGNPMPAADALAAADDAIVRAQQDAAGFDAAVACFLGSGA
jgi:GNAT superfamily N-acetyltransferase